MSVSIVTIAVMSLSLFHSEVVEEGVRESMLEDMGVVNKLLAPMWRQINPWLDFTYEKEKPLLSPHWVPHDQPTPYRNGPHWMKLRL